MVTLLLDEVYALREPFTQAHARLSRGGRTVPVVQQLDALGLSPDDAATWRELWLTEPPSPRTLKLFGRMILDPFFASGALEEVGAYLAHAPQVVRDVFDHRADVWPLGRLQAILQAVPVDHLPHAQARWLAHERAKRLADTPSTPQVRRRRA